MGLVGRLEDLGLPDILQIISLTKKTGKLTLTRREGSGVIIFQNGQVICAVSDFVRDTLGNLLVCQRLITESTLIAALEVQHLSPTGERLGAILVEKGHLTRETLEKVIRQQLEKIVYEFLTWKNGFFKFEMSAAPEKAELAAEAKDLLLAEGVSADSLRLEGLRRLEEQMREQAAKGAAASPDAALSSGPPPEASQQTGEALGLLKAVLAGVRSPAFASEVTSTLMRFAAAIVNRGVLFCLMRDEIRGVSQFGLTTNGTQPDELVRKIVIPLGSPSLLTEVSVTKQTYRGSLPRSTWNDALVKQLGGSVPPEVVAVPMIIDGRVEMIFYGDNLPQDRPIRGIEGLELFMVHAGLAIEKDILAKKIEGLEQKHPPLPRPAARGQHIAYLHRKASL